MEYLRFVWNKVDFTTGYMWIEPDEVFPAAAGALCFGQEDIPGFLLLCNSNMLGGSSWLCRHFLFTNNDIHAFLNDVQLVW